jgi:hypothetical protein
MKIYYVMIEVVPAPDNQEDTANGAYANCFVKADSEESAVESAKTYMQDQGWDYISVEEVSFAERDRYLEDETTLAVYDEACQYGVSGIIYAF